MYSNVYYQRVKVRFIVILSIIVYVTSLWLIYNEVKHTAYKSNQKKSYVYSYVETTSEISDAKPEEFYLSEVEYDESTLYLDWDTYNENQKKIELEYDKAEQEVLQQQKEEEEASKGNVWDKDHNDQVAENTSGIITPVGSLPLPDVKDTSFKSYMCMHTVTARDSKQWEFLHSGKYSFTSDQNGLLKYKNYYVVAMASYYTKYKVGSTFRITLESGKVFDVITGDEKADKDTDARHMYRPMSDGRANIVEFITCCGKEGKPCTSYNTMPSELRASGNISNAGFEGNVIKIEKLDDYSVSNSLYGS